MPTTWPIWCLTNALAAGSVNPEKAASRLGVGRVRGDEPEHGVGVGEGPVDHVGVTVRAGHYVDALAYLGGELGWVACDDTKLLVPKSDAFEECAKDLAADIAGWGGNHDHDNHPGAPAEQRPIPLPTD